MKEIDDTLENILHIIVDNTVDEVDWKSVYEDLGKSGFSDTFIREFRDNENKPFVRPDGTIVICTRWEREIRTISEHD